MSQISLAFSIFLLMTSSVALGEELMGSLSNGNDVIQEEPHGPIDFSEGEVQKDGSICVIKTKMVPKLQKLQVKECWHQNITQCHETYVTEFRPAQEQQCEENFWKACKITFRETPYNYTLKTCMTPLVKKCDDQTSSSYNGYGAPVNSRPEPQMVCKTWFESTCNTTYSINPTNGKPKPQTWCSKEPRKICAPDNCRMEPGEEICHDKTLESTVRKPEEVCDLQPQTQCRLVTNLVPHLETQTVCKEVPKEVCHLKLDNPKMVPQPVKLKWCTRRPQVQQQQSYGAPSSYQYQRPQPPPQQQQQQQNYEDPQGLQYEESQPQQKQRYGAPQNVRYLSEPSEPQQQFYVQPQNQYVAEPDQEILPVPPRRNPFSISDNRSSYRRPTPATPTTTPTPSPIYYRPAEQPQRPSSSSYNNIRKKRMSHKQFTKQF